MPTLPTGTVTLPFAHIQGGTSRCAWHSGALQRAIRRCNRFLGRANVAQLGFPFNIGSHTLYAALTAVTEAPLINHRASHGSRCAAMIGQRRATMASDTLVTQQHNVPSSDCAINSIPRCRPARDAVHHIPKALAAVTFDNLDFAIPCQPGRPRRISHPGVSAKLASLLPHRGRKQSARASATNTAGGEARVHEHGIVVALGA